MSFRILHTYGVTEIVRHKTRKIDDVVITHFGNQGASISDVAQNVDRIYGEGKFAKIREHPRSTENGSADYAYSLRMSRADFEHIVGV